MVMTRFITIRGKDNGGGAAVTIAGHHVRHYLFGIILLPSPPQSGCS
jgi:hypothetical protein